MTIPKYLDPRKYVAAGKRLFKPKYKVSYAQCGEDLLIECALATLGVAHPTYIDVGTNTPIAKNNTYLFYTKGGHGVCVEPNPDLCVQIKKVRPRDTCLNVGIGPTDSKAADYYVMTSKALNTFVKSEAEKYVHDRNYGAQAIERVLHIPLMPLATLIETRFPVGFDILSIDTEGYDLEILASLDLEKYRPKIICVETARYDSHGKIKKQDGIIQHLLKNGYFLYADTYVNSLFVDTKIWPL